MQTCCPILELRQYTLHPGKRDALIDLFEREFIESQEALGMTLVGQFRDLDDPDRFVWLRGFADMETRAKALGAFYGGPVWKAHREAANETMIDSDNVLLLRPARPGSGFELQDFTRQPLGATDDSGGLVTAVICHLLQAAAAPFVNDFEKTIQPELRKTGAPALACFVTENQPNNFPALPVRESANVFVWFSIFHDTSGDAALMAVAESVRPRVEALEILRLQPTPRSRLHG